MNEPRPRITSARPLDGASSVEKRWKTRTGSSERSTVTAEPSRMRFVRAGDRGQHHLRRRDGEIGAVMLADADEVDADLVGEHCLLDDVADDLRMRQEACRRRAAVTSPKVSRPNSNCTGIPIHIVVSARQRFGERACNPA